ncbi:MAG: hypothetical protein DRJ64_00355 [Thermoprotei archaeon]|nr:MAG: hypothetical protein DRJ64_00355 [Thermoprotei archaeon]
MAKSSGKRLFMYFLVFIIGVIIGIYTTSNRGYENKIRALVSEINSLKDKLQVYELENKNLKEQLKSCENNLQEKEKTIYELKEKILLLNRNISYLEEIIVSKEAQIDALKRNISVLMEEIKGNMTGGMVSNVTIILLPDREYYNVAQRLISKANKSVYLAVYALKYDPRESIYDDPVNMLLKELVGVQKKGIDVRVLVDDVTNKSYRQTIEYLRDNNIPVRLDPKKGVTTHVKILIIDSKWVFIGSHNWTESALWYNHEYSVLIGSQYYAKKVEEYFNDLWKNGREC